MRNTKKSLREMRKSTDSIMSMKNYLWYMLDVLVFLIIPGVAVIFIIESVSG